MIDTGTLAQADLGDERLRRVLVLSSRRFSVISGRAVVAPEWPGPLDSRLPPWRVQVDDGIYAVDRIVSIALDRLLDEIGEAPYGAVIGARRALVAIT